MNRCIYSGADESSESFKSQEHIFPKCIGGSNCLPKGYVSDQTNNTLSKLELGFARANPTVTISRMFLPQMGRKKHSNRDHIAVFRKISDGDEYTLGYIRNGTPYSINQIIITSALPVHDNATIPVRFVLAPNYDTTHEHQLQSFWSQLRTFRGVFTCIKDKRIPEQTYILGTKDNYWYFGISQSENPELIKPHLIALVNKMASSDTENILMKQSNTIIDMYQVEASFSLNMNYPDILRVYAKTAVNCLAALKGQDFVLSASFSAIKRAILTGENIDKYVWTITGDTPVWDVLNPFQEKLMLGTKYHSAVFIDREEELYCMISLFGLSNPYVVKLGNVSRGHYTDFYICDWENKRDYTMIDCVLKICDHGDD